jgi:hypothetical protein
VRALALALLVSVPTLGACAPEPAAPSAVTLDCSQPFETLEARILGQPGLSAAPVEPGEPYRTYSTLDGHASYFVTEPGAPAHPAILMQQAGQGGATKNTGCAYGDRAAFAQLMAYFNGLKAGRQ